MNKQGSVESVDDNESLPETVYDAHDGRNTDIYDICGYIGPTLVCDPQSDSQQSYLDVSWFCNLSFEGKYFIVKIEFT